jgi:hypothetical protein
LLSEESAEEEKFKLWYEKQVSSYIFWIVGRREKLHGICSAF